ncbi:MAG: hypothetical protein PGN13_03870 [Patulibacter minatonensis]
MFDNAIHSPRANRSLLTGCLLWCALVLGLLPVLARSARAAETSSVSASISYSDGSKSKTPLWKNIRITLKRGDETILQGELLPEEARYSIYAAPKLLAVDLDDDGQAEVIVDVYTAGQDCCRRSVIYRAVGSTYEPVVTQWAGTGYRLDDVLGKSSPEFLATDVRFPELFGDADARGPLRVFSFRGGALKDLSSRAKGELRRDARIQWRTWRSIRRKGSGDARPAVAAYVADLVRLGEVPEARAVISNASRNDELRVSRSAFTRTLDRKLVAWGYTKKRLLRR